MKIQCTITRRGDGRWAAQHNSSDLGAFEVTAESRGAAIEKMESEIRYRVEMCPCTGRAFRNLEIEIVETSR